ncbi:NAD-dependent epimerase/dehydratase family protein [Chloroflexota bacterium]
MAILITGVGAIGTHIAARLVDMGEVPVLYDVNPRRDFLASLLDLSRVKVITGDVNDMPFLVETFRNEKIDRMVHMVGLLPRTGISGRPYSGVRTNILGTATVLEAARTAGVGRVVFASSTAVTSIAPAHTSGEAFIDEDFDMKVLSNRPRDIYGISKLTGEYLGLMYNDSYGVDFIAIRIGGGFGPAPGSPMGTSGSILWKLVRNAALGKPVTIDDPSFIFAGRNNYCYMKDVANAFALACFKQDLQKRVYHVSMSTYTHQELVDMVRRIFPAVAIEIKTVSKTPIIPGQESRMCFGDTSAARKELGWEPQYDLEAGIKDWAEWIRNNESLSSD